MNTAWFLEAVKQQNPQANYCVLIKPRHSVCITGYVCTQYLEEAQQQRAKYTSKYMKPVIRQL